jgi:hypothetical protein
VSSKTISPFKLLETGGIGEVNLCANGDFAKTKYEIPVAKK